MRPQIVRLSADIVCFQEVNGQERPNEPRSLLALTELLSGTSLAGAQLASTRTANNEVYDERNLVVATSFPVLVFSSPAMISSPRSPIGASLPLLQTLPRSR
jgi:endonuclease/exonuclease/phosphatase family metal-dependent hydrolase